MLRTTTTISSIKNEYTVFSSKVARFVKFLVGSHDAMTVRELSAKKPKIDLFPGYYERRALQIGLRDMTLPYNIPWRMKIKQLTLVRSQLILNYSRMSFLSTRQFDVYSSQSTR